MSKDNKPKVRIAVADSAKNSESCVLFLTIEAYNFLGKPRELCFYVNPRNELTIKLPTLDTIKVLKVNRAFSTQKRINRQGETVYYKCHTAYRVFLAQLGNGHIGSYELEQEGDVFYLNRVKIKEYKEEDDFWYKLNPPKSGLLTK